MAQLEGSTVVDRQAKHPCPYQDGELLRVIRGGFSGEILRVNGRYCFWSEKAYYEADPAKGLLCEAGWQIVVDIELPDGTWAYMFREHEREIDRYTERVSK